MTDEFGTPQSVPDAEVHEDVLTMSPQLSHYSDTIVHHERLLHEQYSQHLVLGKSSGCNSTTSMVLESSSIPKPATELIKEIAVLEVEVMNLERHLLSLYRTAFDYHLGSLPSAMMDQGSGSESQDAARCQITDQPKVDIHSDQLYVCNDSFTDITNQSNGLQDSEDQRHCKPQHATHSSAGLDTSASHPPRENPKNQDMQKSRSGFRSLADHLGTSLADHIPMTPGRLSEDILRCISSIYCKLSNPSLPQLGLSASPTSSLSSSSTFSPQDQCDNWSPKCNGEATVDPNEFEGLKEKHGPYSGMVQVPRIYVDGDRFNYAATMLQNFRSLIQRLENVDPRTMKYEEKLAFWINIHNALVMHAYLAYGVPQNHMKSESFRTFGQKAVYNVGGHFINAFVIQSSILGCCFHRPATWVRTLFSQGMKFRTGDDKHVYALDQPEPLVHFALCSGAYSDPAVRLYTAKSIFQELELAREEFIQASIHIHKDKKIILPKLLCYFAKDASLDLSGILDMIHDCLPGAQQTVNQRYLKGRLEKYVQWSSHNWSFRYIIHRELAHGRKSF
ncbi:uncharacterized protein LOC143845451 isoform X3 [Tasmannia lanceolata]|uniref:uncharacterized protein LOC143845451 isoform X3 n=1 Tax=Tasmannia lanceolata TaxID=3420 RepID=UPI0040636124